MKAECKNVIYRYLIELYAFKIGYDSTACKLPENPSSLIRWAEKGRCLESNKNTKRWACAQKGVEIYCKINKSF